MRLGFFISLCLFWCLPVGAQAQARAVFDAATLSPTLGEPLELVLVVTAPAGGEPVFPTIEGDWGDFTVLGSEAPVSVVEGERVIYTASYQVVPWGIGEISTPLTQVELLVDGEPEMLTVEPLFLNVPLTVDEQSELVVAREVWSLGYTPLWVLLLAGITAGSGAVLGGVTIRRVFQRRNRYSLSRKVQRTIGQRTLQNLARLQQESPDWATQYIAMGDALRFYLNERFDIPLDFTTTETLSELDSYLQGSQLHDELRYLLDQADLAKFAPQHVLQAQQKPVIDLAIGWVRRVENRATGK